MKVTITGKNNVKADDALKEIIEKKMQKLSKYFSDDIVANVVLSAEKSRKKVEATINARGMIFRAECVTEDFYEGIDSAVDKLSSQMSRFKTKIQRKHKDNKQFSFAQWPENTDEPEELNVVKTKKFELEPMTVDEAILQMEMLEHNFFVFLNMETDSVNVVYRRSNDNYGLLETTY